MVSSDLSLRAPLRLEIHKVKRHRAHGEADIRRREDAHDDQQEAAVLQTRLEQLNRRKCCQLLWRRVEGVIGTAVAGGCVIQGLTLTGETQNASASGW